MMFVIAYALILTVTYVVDSREKMARQMTETARLNEELSRAQLAALRGQMDPHFMFNTLNSIASLVYEQRGDAAVGMIVGLSEFLRRASEDSHRSHRSRCGRKWSTCSATSTSRRSVSAIVSE